jgi:hypothetical protein
MRVFYEYEDDKRRYYVKISNLAVPSEWHAFEAASTEDLMAQIADYYKLNKQPIQLWTNHSPNGKQLDTYKEIPKDVEFICVKVIANNQTTN